MLQKELAQHYVLEIAARATTVQNRCTRLLDEEFFSTAPPIFARTIQRMCAYLSKATLAIYDDIDWSLPAEDIDDDLRILQNTDQIIKILNQQLRYVEAARTERLPWSIVASFEKLVAAFLPNIQIMLRAMWQYNYAFHMLDQGQVFRRYLAGYHAYVPDMELERDVFQEMNRPFHIISFPSLEQKHILLHCLLGHEIGHLLVTEFLTKEREAALIDALKSEISKLADEDLQQLPDSLEEEARRAVKEALIGRKLEEALFFWRRALEELLSDSAGVLLFGPAALFSTLDLAMQTSLDVVPSADTDYYPPWRMRLRHGLELLDHQGGWFPIPDDLFKGDTERARRVNDRVSLIRDLAAKQSDRFEISKSRLAHLVYREVAAMVSAGNLFLTNTKGLGHQQATAVELYPRLPSLIERLDYNIPPNAIEDAIDPEQIATFAEILNAAWFKKLSLPSFDPVTGQFDPVGVETRNLMNNLTLKAIEFAHLATEYAEWKP